MNIDQLITQNRETRFYCLGKNPRGIQAAKEYLQAFVDGDYSVTFHSLSEKYGIHVSTIRGHAEFFADMFSIKRTIYRDGKLTFQRPRPHPQKLKVTCPYCKKTFDITKYGCISVESSKC